MADLQDLDEDEMMMMAIVMSRRRKEGRQKKISTKQNRVSVILAL